MSKYDYPDKVAKYKKLVDIRKDVYDTGSNDLVEALEEATDRMWREGLTARDRATITAEDLGE